MMMFPALASALQAQQTQQVKQPASSLGPVTQTPVNASMTPNPSPALKFPSQLGPTTQGPTINTSIGGFDKQPSSLGGPGGYGFQAGPQAAMSDHMSLFKQPSSLGGVGGYSAQQGPSTSFGPPPGVNHNGHEGLRRAMMARFEPREQMYGRRR